MQRRNRCCFRVSEDIFVVCVLTGAVRLDSNSEMCPPDVSASYALLNTAYYRLAVYNTAYCKNAFCNMRLFN